MNLPQHFTQTVKNTFEDGPSWLEALPDLLNYCQKRWDLKVGQPFELSFNYVCQATRADGSELVLKLGLPNAEFDSEVETLRLYNGGSYVRLLDSDSERGVMLLERLRPGSMLAELEDDEATYIALELMQKLWKPAPEEHNFVDLVGWTRAIFELEDALVEDKAFPKDLLRRAQTSFELLYDDPDPVLLHGDFHHMNILKSGTDWRVIDPKGVAGSRLFELGAFLHNPYLKVTKDMLARRIAIFTEGLGLERQAIIEAALAQFVLSSCWSYPHEGYDKVLALARLLTEL